MSRHPTGKNKRYDNQHSWYQRNREHAKAHNLANYYKYKMVYRCSDCGLVLEDGWKTRAHRIVLGHHIEKTKVFVGEA